MNLLNDKDIRLCLINRLKNQSVKPKAVIEELRVHNGNAIADVVALYKDAHCFEIKGDNDKIERILNQGKYYDLAFRKITLVTTKRHLEKALHLAPAYWGIMIAQESDNEKVTLKHIRKTRINFNFKKDLALLTLWKSEMLELIEQSNSNVKNKSRELLAKLISNNQHKASLSEDICSTLLTRHQQATLT